MSEESGIEVIIRRTIEERWTLQCAGPLLNNCQEARLATPADLLAAGYVPASDVAALKAEVERLVKERDEAKAELKTIIDRLGGVPSWETVTANLGRAHSERDAAQEELARLRPVVEAAKLVRAACAGDPKWLYPEERMESCNAVCIAIDALNAEPPKGSGR